MQKTSREKAGSLPVTQTATTIGQGDARVTLSQTLADPARAIFVLILAGILALAIAGLPLAIVGSFYPIPVAALSIALWVPLTVMAWRLTSSSKHISTLASWLVVGVAAAFAFFTMSNSGEHVLTNRDPGVYVITGKWLAAHGNLVYDNGLPADVASSLTHPNSWSSQGIYAQGPGTGVFQFQHLTGVVLAASHWVGGDWLLYRIMGAVAAASLLGLFLVSRRIAGQIFGIIPVVVAAVHPAFIHFAKDVYSEWFAMTFAMAAFVVWLNRPKEKDDWHYLGVGLLLGAGTLARIDAWLTAGAFMAGIAYLVVTAGDYRPTRRQIGLLSAGFVPLAALGTIDLIVRSRPYFTALAGEFLLMVGVLSVAIVFMVAFSMITPGRLEKPSRFLRTAVPWLGVMILLAGLYGLLVRPYVSEPSLGHSIGHIAAIETREGLEVEWFTQLCGSHSRMDGAISGTRARHVRDRGSIARLVRFLQEEGRRTSAHARDPDWGWSGVFLPSVDHTGSILGVAPLPSGRVAARLRVHCMGRQIHPSSPGRKAMGSVLDHRPVDSRARPIGHRGMARGCRPA